VAHLLALLRQKKKEIARLKKGGGLLVTVWSAELLQPLANTRTLFVAAKGCVWLPPVPGAGNAAERSKGSERKVPLPWGPVAVGCAARSAAFGQITVSWIRPGLLRLRYSWRIPSQHFAKRTEIRSNKTVASAAAL
jgi:hypothetical protein